jgi:hypothetical protein
MLTGFMTVFFYVVGLLASCPIPDLEGQGIPFVCVITLHLSGMEALPVAFANTNIALGII